MHLVETLKTKSKNVVWGSGEKTLDKVEIVNVWKK
jgi:hypothetical protein